MTDLFFLKNIAMKTYYERDSPELRIIAAEGDFLFIFNLLIYVHEIIGYVWVAVPILEIREIPINVIGSAPYSGPHIVNLMENH